MLVLAAGSAGAGPNAPGTKATARAFDVKVIVPGGGGGTQEVTAPPQTVAVGPSFTYGASVETGSLTANATTDIGSTAVGSASADVASVSLFGGEVTATTVSVRAKATARPGSASGDLSGSVVNGLTVLGQPVAATPNLRVALADWGYVIVLEQSAAPVGAAGFNDYVIGLDVHLTADHGDLPAGSEIQVGYAAATARAPAEAPPTTTTPTMPAHLSGSRGARPAAKPPKKAPEPSTTGPPPLIRRAPPPDIHPALGPGGYVFPVYGPSSFTDTFGAFRGDIPGNWHHGDDIFAPLGAPILAVAKGTVFSVGWNEIGGYRVWLRDQWGNEFYYAHLSAYSPLAVNNAHVQAGAVLGFVGNSGDAEGTPYHLHFEVHPVGRLGLGYDGAVDPTAYLEAWKHLQSVQFDVSASWAPTPNARVSAPEPGAIVLQVSDISSASGLDPASLQRVLSQMATEGGAGILHGLAPSGPAPVRTSPPLPAGLRR